MGMPGLSPRVCAALVSFAFAFAFASALSAQPARALEPPSIARPRAPITLELGVRGGFSHRLGEGSALPVATRFGGVFGLSAAISPSPAFAVGLVYEHSGLGSEHGAGDAAELDAGRTLDVLWAGLRLNVLRTDRVLAVAQLGPGLAFQHLSARGEVLEADGTKAPLSCGGSGSPGVGLRVGLGVEVRVAKDLWFTSDAVFDQLRLSSELLGDCDRVVGAGSLSIVGFRFGLTFRRDVSRYLR